MSGERERAVERLVDLLNMGGMPDGYDAKDVENLLRVLGLVAIDPALADAVTSLNGKDYTCEDTDNESRRWANNHCDRCIAVHRLADAMLAQLRGER